MFESAKALGFSDEAHARDFCQLQFLAQLMRQGADRFVLKGGMAMRTLYGSARLTKDIDFDCEDSVSTQSMQAQIPKALTLAGRAASLAQIEVAMAAGKVNALLSPNRSVPRDVYDLYDFVQAQVDPSNLWAAAVPREVLQRKCELVYAKVDGIRFEHANAELLPYLTPAARASLNVESWDAMRLEVAERLAQWFQAAISRAKLAKETLRDPQSDADLAGR